MLSAPTLWVRRKKGLVDNTILRLSMRAGQPRNFVYLTINAKQQDLTKCTFSESLRLQGSAKLTCNALRHQLHAELHLERSETEDRSGQAIVRRQVSLVMAILVSLSRPTSADWPSSGSPKLNAELHLTRRQLGNSASRKGRTGKEGWRAQEEAGRVETCA